MSTAIDEFMGLWKRRQELRTSLAECEDKLRNLRNNPEIVELAKAIDSLTPKTHPREIVMPSIVGPGFDRGGFP